MNETPKNYVAQYIERRNNSYAWAEPEVRGGGTKPWVPPDPDENPIVLLWGVDAPPSLK